MARATAAKSGAGRVAAKSASGGVARLAGRMGGRTTVFAGGRVAVAVAVAVSIVATAGCERVVDVEIPDPEPRLVVEGRIERVGPPTRGLQRIRLTTTDAFFSNREPPPATGAVVTVTSGSGEVVPFREREREPGIYITTDIRGVIGETYTLSIDWAGDRYEASALMHPVARIESLDFVYALETIFTEEAGYRASIDYTDPPGTNFYMWEILVDGDLIIPPDPGNRFNLVSSDDLYDGRRVNGFVPNDEVAIPLSSRVTVRQMSLSRLGYDYHVAIFDQSALGTGNPFSIPPATIRGNVANLTRPDRYAFGYFGASQVSEVHRRAPAEIPPSLIETRAPAGDSPASSQAPLPAGASSSPPRLDPRP